MTPRTNRVTGFYEHGYEALGSIKLENFLKTLATDPLKGVTIKASVRTTLKTTSSFESGYIKRVVLTLVGSSPSIIFISNI